MRCGVLGTRFGMWGTGRVLVLVGAVLAAASAASARQVTGDVPAGRPDAIVDLASADGVRLVKGQWRYSDTRIVENEKGLDIVPQAGAAGFDDGAWETIEPATLEKRRTAGKLSFNWYRINITVPERVGAFDTAGSTIVLETVVDDYAEIWVDGQLPLTLGQTGGALVKGFNAPNRVVVARDAKPGQRIQLAIFGVNGPLSRPPSNFIWIRSATLDFYQAGRTGNVTTTDGRVLRLDPALDRILDGDVKIEKLATGFGFTEGPVWAREGYLLFSDPNNNFIYRWSPDGQVSVYRTKSGYSGVDIAEYRQPGSNGLAFDREGRLTVAEHGNRRISRIERNGMVTVLADSFEGRRLNSPNDLVFKSDGSLYFTDPPFGLPKVFDDPRKELPYSGVYRWSEGKLQLLTKDLTGPNGVAFSPDEKYLYVTNWDAAKKVVMRYAVSADGTLESGRVFFDMTSAPGEEALDGVKVDGEGNLFVSGPGGVWILSPSGRHLGTIQAPELPANMAWGDTDGRTLYLTGRTSLYRIRLKLPATEAESSPHPPVPLEWRVR
jgi:gluconolactonase